MATVSRRSFAAFAAGSLASLCDPFRANGEDIPTLHLLELPTDGAKSVLYAERAGLFRKVGLRTEIVAMGNGATIFAAVAGGAAEIGSGSLFPVFAAYARGIPLRIIAPASLYSSEHADSLLLVKRGSPIRVARDLNGKTLGSDAVADVSSIATRAWLDANGGDGKSLQVVELKQSEKVAALDSGRVDAVNLRPPYLTVAMESGTYRSLGKPLDAIASRFLLSCWIARVDFIAKYPDVVDRFTKALVDAMRWTNANQAKTVDLVAGFTGADPALIARGVRSISAESVTLGDIQRPIDFAFKYGLIDRRFDAREILAPSVPVSRSS
jgi:NitT/TauT family transport system substrate-binding protein